MSKHIPYTEQETQFLKNHLEQNNNKVTLKMINEGNVIKDFEGIAGRKLKPISMYNVFNSLKHSGSINKRKIQPKRACTKHKVTVKDKKETLKEMFQDKNFILVAGDRYQSFNTLEEAGDCIKKSGLFSPFIQLRLFKSIPIEIESVIKIDGNQI